MRRWTVTESRTMCPDILDLFEVSMLCNKPATHNGSHTATVTDDTGKVIVFLAWGSNGRHE